MLRPARPPLSPVGRGWVVALGILTVAAWLPLVLALIASAIASVLGCRLDESGPNPCFLLGQDIGDVLVTMFLMAWLAVFGFPLLIGTAIAWFVVWTRRRR